jgi:hypothetical protein
MSEAILLRTHYFDGSVAELADFYMRSSGREVLLVCDETKNVVDVPAQYKKVSLQRAVLEADGIYVPDDFGWRCGDYSYYAARRAYADFTAYWLIETDVVLKFDDLSTFFDHFPPADEVALLAPGLFKSGPNAFWYKSMAPFSSNVHGCMFPITRLSGRAIDYLMRERAAISPKFLELDAASATRLSWPNDEAFVTTRLMEAGYVCRDINSFGERFYSSGTFWVGAPASAKQVKALPNDGKIYHPVHGGGGFLSKMKIQISGRVRGSKEVAEIEAAYDGAFFDKVFAECGQEGVDTLRAHITSQIAKHKPTT